MKYRGVWGIICSVALIATLPVGQVSAAVLPPHLTPDTICTVAGTADNARLFDALDQASSTASADASTPLTRPAAPVVDTDGTVYFATGGVGRVWALRPNGSIERIAGTGESNAETGDSGPAVNATLQPVTLMAIDTVNHALYIGADTNRTLRRIQLTGAKLITTVAGRDALQPADGAGPNAAILQIGGLAVGPDGVYFSSLAYPPGPQPAVPQAGIYLMPNGGGPLRLVVGNGTPGQVVAGPATDTGVVGRGLAFDGDILYFLTEYGSLWKTDALPSGSGVVLEHVAGQEGTYGDQVGSGATALLPRDLRDVAVDSAGMVYLSGPQHAQIRRVDAAGTVTKWLSGAAGEPVDGPRASARNNVVGGIAVGSPAGQGEAVVFADPLNNRIRAVRIGANQVVTLAGSTSPATTMSTVAARSANFAHVTDVDYDSLGNAYVADVDANVVRKIDVNGLQTVILGTGEAYPDAATLPVGPTPGRLRPISEPWSVAVDKGATPRYLYVASRADFEIVRVDLSTGEAERWAGGRAGNDGDGGPATAAAIGPAMLAADGLGNLYLADQWYFVIRRVDAGGTISLIAGNGQGPGLPFVGPVDGPTIAAPTTQMAATASGQLFYSNYFADAANTIIPFVAQIDPATRQVQVVLGGDPGLVNVADAPVGSTAAQLRPEGTMLLATLGDALFMQDTVGAGALSELTPTGADYRSGIVRLLARNATSNVFAADGSVLDGTAYYSPTALAVQPDKSVAFLESDGNPWAPSSLRAPERLRVLAINGCAQTTAAAAESAVANGVDTPIKDISPANLAAAYGQLFAVPGRTGYTPGRTGYSPGRNSYTPGRNSYTPGRNSYTPGRNSYTAVNGLDAFYDVPLSAVPYNAPSVPEVTLAELPNTAEGGWDSLLADPAFAGRTAQDVTLKEMYAVNPAGFSALTIGDLNLMESPLWEVGLASVAWGRTPLGQIPLSDAAADNNYLDDWCAGFEAVNGPGTCTFNSSTMLIDFDTRNIAQPSSMFNAPAMMLRGSAFANAPLGKAAIDLLDFSVSRLGDLAVPAGFASCTGPCSTLRAAQSKSALSGTKTMMDLLDAVSSTELEGITFNDVLITFQNAAAVEWEQLPLDALGLGTAGPTPTASADTYTASFRLPGVGLPAPRPVTFTIALPPGFSAKVDTATMSVTDVNGVTTPVTDPAALPIAGNPLVFTVPSDVEGPATVHVGVGIYAGYADGSLTGVVSPQFSGDIPVTVPVTTAVTDYDEVASDTPGTANVIQPDTLYVRRLPATHGSVTTADVDYFRIPIPVAGSVTAISLSHLPIDADLVVYKSTPPQWLRSGVALRSSTQNSRSPASNAPLLGPIGLTPSTQPASDRKLAYLPIIGSSSNRGTGDEAVTVVSDGSVGDYIVQVLGYNGASSNDPYLLRYAQFVSDGGPSCHAAFANQMPAPAAAPTIPAETNTLVLVNQQRMRAAYGDTAWANVDQALRGLQSSNTTRAAIITVDSDPAVRAAYAAWDSDSCRPQRANDVVVAINNYVDQILAGLPANQVANLVLVGSDEQLPMSRLPDDTTLANESTYASTVERRDANPVANAEQDNPLSNAMAYRNVLSDDPYASFHPVRDWLTQRVSYPVEIAIGRLVETPAEIIGAVQRYTSSNGLLDPTTVLATGYDFFNELPDAVDTALPDALAVTKLNGSGWTRDQLIGGLTTPPPDVVSLNAHAMVDRLQPAVTTSSADLYRATDIAPGSLDKRIVFSVACHAGLNFPASYADVDRDLNDDGVFDTDRPGAVGPIRGEYDFAQAMAQAGAAAYIANTGYGYGITNGTAFSERLQRDLAANLDRQGKTLGFAFVAAKGDFAAGGLDSAMDDKAVAQYTFYGLPMWAFANPSPARTFGLPLLATPTDLTGKLLTASLTFTGADTAAAARPAGDGSMFYQVANNDMLLVDGHPIEPRTRAVNVAPAQPGYVAHGVVVTSLASTDVATQTTFAEATVGSHSTGSNAVNAEGSFPAILPNLVSVGSVAGGTQRVTVTVGQFVPSRDENAVPGSGVQRLFHDVGLQVFYARADSDDFVPPTIDGVHAITANGSAQFVVGVAADSDGSMPTISYASAVYLDGTQWRRAELTQTADGWVGAGPASVPIVDYFVQVVDSAGNVAVSSNKADNYQAVAAPVAANLPPGLSVTDPLSAMVAPGQQVTWSGQAVDDSPDPLSISATSASGVTITGGPTSNGGFTYKASAAAQGTYDIAFTACDTGALCSTVHRMLVVNVAPSFDSGADVTLTAPARVQRTVAINDPGDPGPWTVTINGTTTTTSTASFAIDRSWATPGTYSVPITVCDRYACRDRSLVVTVVAPAGAAPVVSLATTVTIPVKATLSLNGSFTDPDGGPWTARVNYGSGWQPLPLNGRSFTLQRQYPTAGTYSATVEICDSTALCGQATVQVVVSKSAVVQQLRPIAACAVTASGIRAGLWTYENPNSWIVEIPVGPRNRFSPKPDDRWQVRRFAPGRGVAGVTFDKASVTTTWYLDGRTATMNSRTAVCIS